MVSRRAELKALRIAAEIGGGITLLITVLHWIRSGSPLEAINFLAPIAGGATLAVFAISGAFLLVGGKGLERLGAAASLIGPVLFVVLGLSVARLGLLVLGLCAVELIGLFVDLFRDRPA